LRLLLVRHGESICISKGIVGGEKGCTGLTDRGHAQARALGERLAREGFVADVLLASTLPRARETAAAVSEALSLPVALDEGLKEMIPGAIDGTPWPEFTPFDVEAEPDRELSPGGESLRVFRARIASVLDRLAATYEGQTVIAVSHGGFIFGSLYHGVGAPNGRWNVDVDFTSITEWRWADGNWRLSRFNDFAHLHGTELLVG
jgi:probable phosphoglycerate mutase